MPTAIYHLTVEFGDCDPAGAGNSYAAIFSGSIFATSRLSAFSACHSS